MALISGDVSISQASTILDTVEKVPSCLDDLLRVSKNQSLMTTKRHAKEKILDNCDSNKLAKNQNSLRSFRHYIGDYSMVNFYGSLPPKIGIPLMNRLDNLCDKKFRELRQNKEITTPLKREQIAADVIVEMLSNEITKDKISPKSEIVFVCDISSYIRGERKPGEICKIQGGGPTTPEEVHLALKDSFIKAVLHDGKEVKTIAHYSRNIPAVIRTALELGSPPKFDGLKCVEPNCERTYYLEFDHINPVANNGVTSLENLVPRCKPHHIEKTEKDRQKGLLGKNPKIYARNKAGP